MPDGTEIEVHTQTKIVNNVAEFVQITSAERVKMDAKEQADVRYSTTRKQYNVYKKMDLSSTNLDELVGFQTNLETTEQHLDKFDLHQIFMIVDLEKDTQATSSRHSRLGASIETFFNGMWC
jgi:hypothetical protein